MIVTWRRYQTITGDRSGASAEVEQALTDAQALLEDQLSRSVEYNTYTEFLPLLSDPQTGMLASFPTVYPVHSSTDGLTVRFDTIYGGSPVASPVTPGDFGTIFPLVAELTYVAGWDSAITDPLDRRAVPPVVERDVAWAAYHLLRPGLATMVPAGFKSGTSGDTSVTYADAQSPSTFGISWSKATLAWKRRTI